MRKSIALLLAMGHLWSWRIRRRRTSLRRLTRRPRRQRQTREARSPSLRRSPAEEFLSFDEVARPKLVYWAEGFNQKGKPEDAVFDVETTERLVPVLVEVCRKEPHESFWKKVKEEFKKVF